MILFRRKVFASYSDRDRAMIRPVVQLLRTARGWVFFAPDSIPAGSRWEKQLRRAVRRCRLMVVFWCRHSSDSEWVVQEYTLAIGLKKKVVPVLLDNTPVPEALEVFQGIDFRGWGDHEDARGHPPSQFSPVSALASEGGFSEHGSYHQFAMRKRRLGGALALLGLLMMLLAVWRPFSPPIGWEPDDVSGFNGLVLLFGFAIMFLGARTSVPAVALNPRDAQERLAASLDKMIRSED